MDVYLHIKGLALRHTVQFALGLDLMVQVPQAVVLAPTTVFLHMIEDRKRTAFVAEHLGLYEHDIRDCEWSCLYQNKFSLRILSRYWP